MIKHFTKDDIRMTNKCKDAQYQHSPGKYASKSQQNSQSTTNQNHFPSIIMAINTKTDSNKYYTQWKVTGILLYYWQEKKLVQPLRKIVWQSQEQVNRQLSCDPIIQLKRHMLKNMSTKNLC